MALLDMVKNPVAKIKRQYLTDLVKDVNTIFFCGDLTKINRATEKLDAFHKYVVDNFGGAELRPKDERIAEEKERLTQILMTYEFGQIINPAELVEKTGLKLRQLHGYTLGKNPLLKKEGKDYSLARILKKNPSDS